MKKENWTETATVSFSIEPWYSEFVDAIMQATYKAIHQGMPVEVATSVSQLCNDSAKTAIIYKKDTFEPVGNVTVTDVDVDYIVKKISENVMKHFPKK